MTNAEIETFLYTQIPITRGLGAKVIRAEIAATEIAAPLANNINHLGTAFGGSLNAILVLAGYTWVFQALEKKGKDSHVILKSSHVEYFFPVREEIHAICLSPDQKALDAFLRTFEKKGKGRIILDATIDTSEGEACRFTGEFVAIKAEKFRLG